MIHDVKQHVNKNLLLELKFPIVKIKIKIYSSKNLSSQFLKLTI